MTAPDPRLDEIQALADGLTGLCPEHLRQSIRHVQRNCDIECNDHPNGDPWNDCEQPGRCDGERMAKALASIPYLLAELRKARESLERVEALHSHAHRDVEPWAIGYRFGGDHCAHDGQHWPCETRAAVAAAKGDERG